MQFRLPWTKSSSHAPDIEAWYHEHYSSVWGFCRRRVGVRHADDTTQETFVIAFQRRETYRSETPVRAFLYGIANKVCANWSRKKDLESLDWLDREPASLDPSEAIVTSTALKDALLRLSEEHREVVLLKEMEGMTYEEIGAVLAIPAGTVKSRLHHAFLALRKDLQRGNP